MQGWFLMVILLCRYAGGSASAGELEAAGVGESSAGSSAARRVQENTEAGNMHPPATGPLISCVGAGLPPLPQKMIERIRAKQYIDFAELPPAKGKGRPVTQLGEGQLVLLQASNLVQAKKAIPDFATWGQCFAIYVAVLAGHDPDRLLDLMGTDCQGQKAL